MLTLVREKNSSLRSCSAALITEQSMYARNDEMQELFEQAKTKVILSLIRLLKAARCNITRGFVSMDLRDGNALPIHKQISP